MKIVRGVDELDVPMDYPVLTIGNFDGVHVGHQKIISHVVDRARKKKGTSLIMMFDPHPRTYFNPDKPQLQITTFEQRVELIEKLGLEILIVQAFDREFAAVTADEFIENFLVKKIGIAEIFISSKFRFGKSAAGGIDNLTEAAPKYDFQLTTVEN